MSANNSQQSGFLGYDLFKLIVALALLIILILLLLRGCSGTTMLEGATQEATGAGTSRPGESTPTKIIDKAPVITSPNDKDQITGTSVMLKGTAEPGTEVLILEGGIDSYWIVKSVMAGSDGSFSVNIDAIEGQHNYQAASDPANRHLTTIENLDVMYTLLLSNAVTVTVSLVSPTTPSTPTQPTSPTSIPPTATPAIASGGVTCDGLISGYLLDEEHYVVGSCDTLSGIAVWLDVSVESLLESNPQITDPDTIIPGQIVNVPPK